jgi:alcohol dehydrogenase (NADP+)
VQVFVTGKLWNANHGAGKVEKACRKTLRDLRLKQLDLYLIHWPVAGANRGAAVTPSLRETWQAMEALVDAGLVKAIGLSNFSVKKAKDVLEYARVRPSVMQVSPSGGDDKVAAQLCYTWVSLWSSH